MGSKDPRVDEYIAQATGFARPILERLREIIHDTAPEITEDIKWGMPAFMHKGIVGNMAAFSEYVSLGFWKGKLMRDAHALFEDQHRTQVTALKLRSVDDIPDPGVLAEYIREAVELNERGVKLPTRKRSDSRDALDVPKDLGEALKANPDAGATFEAFSYTNRKEYIEWITGARRDATRERRLAQAIEWMSEGKPRNWKYQRR